MAGFSAAFKALKLGKNALDRIKNKPGFQKFKKFLTDKAKGYDSRALAREDGLPPGFGVAKNRAKKLLKGAAAVGGTGAGALGVSSAVNRSKEAKNKKILDAAREKVSFVGDGKPKKFSGKLMQDKKKKAEDKKKTTTKAKAPKKVTPKFKYESSSQTKDNKKKKKKYDSLPKGMSARLAYGGGMMKKKMAYGGKVKKMMGGGRVKKRYV